MRSHYLTCGGGCHHLVPLNIEDSRPAFECMVIHLTGTHGGIERDSGQASRTARGGEVIGEYAAQTRFETPCPALMDHSPHGHPVKGCYGNGPFRRVPPLKIPADRDD